MKHFILSILLFQFFHFFSNAQFSIAGNQVEIPLHLNTGTVLNSYNENFFSANYIEKSIIVNSSLFQPNNKKVRSGFGRGVWIGALTGSVSGGIIGLVTYTPCEGFCILTPSSLGDSFAAGVIVGAISGAIIGGITGLVIKLTKKK